MRWRGRWRLLTGCAVVLVLAIAVTGIVIDLRGSYGSRDVHNLCDLVDASPLRQANPLATRVSHDPHFYRDGGTNGRVVGARVLHCVLGLGGADRATASSARVAAAYYPSRRDAALVFNESKRGDLTVGGDRTAYTGPTLPDPVASVHVGRVADVTGVDAPQAFCATLRSGAPGSGQVSEQIGYLVMAQNGNLVVEVVAMLTGERMDLARRRYAAATIMSHVLAWLRR